MVILIKKNIWKHGSCHHFQNVWEDKNTKKTPASNKPVTFSYPRDECNKTKSVSPMNSSLNQKKWVSDDSFFSVANLQNTGDYPSLKEVSLECRVPAGKEDKLRLLISPQVVGFETWCVLRLALKSHDFKAKTSKLGKDIS